ncbi:MAG: DUF3194 domain-containing protein [Candidatus Bathyarchaeia archaeon]
MSKRPISDLSYEEIEKICEIAEDAARKYIMSKVPSEYISDLSVSVDVESMETLNVDIEIEIELSPIYRKANAEEIAKDSLKAAFDAIERYLENIRSQARNEANI